MLLLIIFPVYIFVSLYSMDKYYFLCPIQYKGNIIIRSDGWGDGFFASRRNGRRVHEGIDLLAEIGTPVLAVRTGMVAAATKSRGMGNYVILRHPGGVVTIYGHLSSIAVRRMEFVRQGDVIGAVGRTGNANYSGIQPHLHFEVRKNGIPDDPLNYLE